MGVRSHKIFEAYPCEIVRIDTADGRFAIRRRETGTRLCKIVPGLSPEQWPVVWRKRGRPPKPAAPRKFLAVASADDRTLLTDFVRLARPSTTPPDVLRFAARWGLLGLAKVGDEEYVDDWIVEARRTATLLRQGKVANGQGQLTDENLAGMVGQKRKGVRARLAKGPLSADEKVHALAWIRRTVEHELSERLRPAADSIPPASGVFPRAWQLPNGHIEIDLFLPRLMDAVNVQLALAIGDGRLLKACGNCGAIFEATRRDAKWCPGRSCRQAASNARKRKGRRAA